MAAGPGCGHRGARERAHHDEAGARRPRLSQPGNVHGRAIRLLEKLGEWLNLLWENAAKLQAHAAWVGASDCMGIHSGGVRGAGVGAVATGTPLAHTAGSGERRTRRRSRFGSRLATVACGTRDGPLLAGSGARRFTSSIGRQFPGLNRKRLWPADRARTPREYLALVAAEDPRKAGLPRSLAALSGSLGTVEGQRVRGTFRRRKRWPTG
jgi:hypothetical protein